MGLIYNNKVCFSFVRERGGCGEEETQVVSLSLVVAVLAAEKF